MVEHHTYIMDYDLNIGDTELTTGRRLTTTTYCKNASGSRKKKYFTSWRLVASIVRLVADQFWSPRDFRCCIDNLLKTTQVGKRLVCD